MDVAQITIRGALVLCAEVERRRRSRVETLSRPSASATSNVRWHQRDASRRSRPSDACDGRRLLVTLLAPSNLGAPTRRRLSRHRVAADATCERIVHLASYPVDCYELVVRRA